MKKSKKSSNYIAKPGETVKIVTNQIRKKMGLTEEIKPKENSKRIQNFRTGNFYHSDFKYAIWGLELLDILQDKGFDHWMQKICQEENVEQSKINKTIALAIAQRPILNGIYTSQKLLESEYNEQREKAHTEYMNEIIQNTRDGVITKTQERVEKDEQGNERIVQYDTSMTEEEIGKLMRDYSRALYEIQEKKVPVYLGLGMNILRNTRRNV